MSLQPRRTYPLYSTVYLCKGRASEERDMNRNQTTHSLAVKKVTSDPFEVFDMKRLGDVNKWQPTEDGF
ncbi:hypothetical protein Tco_1208812 [Tanacetum coccineum]